jgi:signal transduction histidine kinase
MKSAVVVCESTIRNLLEEARTREPNLVREDLRAVLNRIIAECAVPETVVVTCGFPPVEVIVGVDVALLSMACRNIVKNAVEAMNGVGTITVKMDTDARSVVVSFRDSGPGIAKEHLDRIFQPLFTTKATGVGFGLSVAAMVIGKHGGTIKAESGNGSGAIFIMQLPLWEKSKVSRRESVA